MEYAVPIGCGLREEMTKIGKKHVTWWIRDPAFYKRLATLAFPIAGQNLISFAVGLVDNIMVASLGESAVGGVFVFNQLQNILQMLVMGVWAALVIIAAQYYGKRDILSVKTLCAIAMRFVVLIGLALTVVMALFGRQVLGVLTNEPSVLGEGLHYAKYMKFSFVFFCMSNVLLACLRSSGIVRIGLIVSCVTVVTDAGLNYLLIFGKLGFPAMGVAGAALATLISRMVEFAIVVCFLLRREQTLRLRPKDMLLRNRRLARDYFTYGFPVILGDILWGFGGAAQTAILGRMGAAVIAASAMTSNIYQIFAVLVYGISNAGSLMVGQMIGKDQFDMAKRYTKTLQVVYLGVGIFSAALLLLSRGLALRVYPAVEAETLHYTGQFLVVMDFMLVGTAYQMASLQIVRAGGATHFVLVNDLIFVWLVVVPLSYLMAFVWQGPPWAVYLCLKCDQVLKCGVAAVKVNRFRWMKTLTIR